MVYESSYESGSRPFKPDINRGKWSSPQDFIFVCIGLAFKLDIVTMYWVDFNRAGIFIALPYIVFLFLYVVPLVVIHCFLGQFSSSGFISALRIAPLYKGMGYIALVINYFVLTYYAIYAMVPLFMLISSLNPTLPWSCEAAENWSFNATSSNSYQLCAKNISLEEPAEEDGAHLSTQVPSVLYYKKHFKNERIFALDKDPNSGWNLLGCAALVWIIIAAIFYIFNTTEKLGKILRYMVATVVCAILILLMALHFLESAGDTSGHFILLQSQSVKEYAKSMVSSPLIALCAFGTGWGSIISFASFNNFKTDIMQQSWVICLGQIIVIVLLGWLSLLVENEIHFKTPDATHLHIDVEYILLVASGSVLSTMTFSNLWCLIMYGMLLLGALVIMISQLLSLLVSIFDEFESLRQHKMPVTMGIIGSLALVSIFFCFTNGFLNFGALAMDTAITQVALNLILLLVALWIYGRIRFQRDIEFMLGKRFATWKIFVLRFIAPIGLIYCMLVSLVGAVYYHIFNSTFIALIGAIIFYAIPWIFIPGYAIFKTLQATGTLGERFRSCCRPTDWYPIDAEQRQRYEVAMGNMELTHQLQEIHDEEISLG